MDLMVSYICLFGLFLHLMDPTRYNHHDVIILHPMDLMV